MSTSTASEKGEGLIENEITGVAFPVATNERFPWAGGLFVMFVAREVTSQERAGIDEDHRLSGFVVIEILVVPIGKIPGRPPSIHGIVLEQRILGSSLLAAVQSVL